MLDYNKAIINKNDIKEVLYYDLFALLHQSFVGNWLEVKEYDQNLVEQNLSVGEFWHVSTYLLFHGYINIDQGAFDKAEMIISKLREISKDYGNENGTEFCYTLRIKLFIIFGKLQDALKEVEEGISFLTQTGRETVTIYYLGFRAVIQVLLMDFDQANETLRQTRELASRHIRLLPIYISSSLLGQFLLDLRLLEQSIEEKDKSDISRYSQKTYQSGKRAIKNATKYAFDRAELFRLMGLYYWLIGKKKTAIGFWSRGIKEAQRLGARVELARIYMEIGRRFREIKNGDFKLNGIKEDEYLEKARILFDEMNLLQDLEELSKIMERQ
jgi:tetratricopeptide (TPR) repeat protein